MISRRVLRKLVGKLVVVFTDDKIARWKGWLSKDFDEKSIKLTSRKDEKKSKNSCYIDMDRVIAIREVSIKKKKVKEKTKEEKTPEKEESEN